MQIFGEIPRIPLNFTSTSLSWSCAHYDGVTMQVYNGISRTRITFIHNWWSVTKSLGFFLCGSVFILASWLWYCMTENYKSDRQWMKGIDASSIRWNGHFVVCLCSFSVIFTASFTAFAHVKFKRHNRKWAPQKSERKRESNAVANVESVKLKKLNNTEMQGISAERNERTNKKKH